MKGGVYRMLTIMPIKKKRIARCFIVFCFWVTKVQRPFPDEK